MKDFSKFGKNTLRKIYKIKNYSIWINIRGKIKE